MTLYLAKYKPTPLSYPIEAVAVAKVEGNLVMLANGQRDYLKGYGWEYCQSLEEAQALLESHKEHGERFPTSPATPLG